MSEDLFGQLQTQVASRMIQSKFDLDKFEITEEDKAIVVKEEREFFKNFKKLKNNLFALCQSLAKIEEALKPSGSFMEWYRSNGYSKDMISIMLKRWHLYLLFQDHRDKIFGFSDRAIRILTHKDVMYDEVLLVLEGNLTRAVDIKATLQPCIEQHEIEYRPRKKLFNARKIEKLERTLEELPEEEVEELKKELEDYIARLQALLEK